MQIKAHRIIFPGLLFLSLLRFTACYRETVVPETHFSDRLTRVIGFDGIYACADTTDHLLLYSIGADTIPSFNPEVQYEGKQSVYLDGKALENGKENEIGRVMINQAYQVITSDESGSDTFRLMFTRFPIASFVTGEEIMYEPKVLSWMELQYCNEGIQDHSPHLYESFAGIEIRGHSSTAFPKKPYGIELWKDQYENDHSASLLGMRYGEDWFLDAMRTDDLRMRNKLSFDLWEKIGRIPEEDRLADIYPGVHREYVELFINNRYEGIYCLGEKMDERILDYSSQQHALGGVLYEAVEKAEGATRFEIYDSEPGNSLYWDGWEQIYPENGFYWDPLAGLRKAIVLDSDEDFTASIASLIDLENVADIYIFYNLISAWDNVGKNNFYARYTDQSRFFIIPWDLDYTWGRIWPLKEIGPGGIIANSFFRRLLATDADDFNELLEHRWEGYRENIMHKDTLIAAVDRYYNILQESGVIERENARWDDVQIDHKYEYDYITNWIEQRLLNLDNVFDSK